MRPLIPVLALLHLQQDRVYTAWYFAQTLLEQNSKLRDILFIETDRENAITNGYFSQFR